MQEYDKECLEFFLLNQTQLFDEKVVETMREAKEFLEDVMAVVVNNPKEVKAYFEDSGIDTSGMAMEEILAQSEVFKLERTGRYLIVEG